MTADRSLGTLAVIMYEPTWRHLPQLDEAWSHAAGGARLDAVERAAPALRDALLESGNVLATRTFDIATFPYPARYAFQGALRLPLEYVWMTNRAVLVEYRDGEGRRRRFIANPSWDEGSRKAPYFRELTRIVPKRLEPLMSRVFPPLTEQLRKVGVDPATIDYVAFDHLHVQDVRPMLGPRGFYPNAKLIVTRTERAAVARLHPLQRYWYVEGALDGVPADRIIEIDRDVRLGDGLAIVRTPGHTEGNQTIVIGVPGGLVTISENGIATDCYAPERSAIPGLARFATRNGTTVILNANTRENTLDQYTSMRLEIALARATDGSGWPRHFCSSELTAFPLAPGVRPTFAWERLTHGAIAS